MDRVRLAWLRASPALQYARAAPADAASRVLIGRLLRWLAIRASTARADSEGHRKVRVRLRQRGVHAGKARVLRLMGVHGLLASRGRGTSTAIPPTPVASRPSGATSSGTDATCFWSERDGWCWFFGAIDHATDELVGWKATKRGDRWAALEPLYQGVRYAFGSQGRGAA